MPGILPELPSQTKPQQPSQPPTEGGLPGLPELPGLPVEPEKKNSPLPGPSTNGQPKEDATPKEQPKAKEPSTSDKSQPGAFRDVVAVPFASAEDFDPWAGHRGSVIPAASNQPLDQSEGLPDTHHADSIAVVPVEPAAREVEAAAYATVESVGTAEVGDAPAAMPTVALNGYCPVALIRNGRWTPGDVRFTVVRGGRIYRLSGPAERQQFLAAPDAFTPAYAGNDPVLAVDQRQTVPGRPAYCAMCNGHLYLFTSAATREQFHRDPQRYAAGK